MVDPHLGSHIISSEGYEPPASYADIFRVLRDEGVVEPGDRFRSELGGDWS